VNDVDPAQAVRCDGEAGVPGPTKRSLTEEDTMTATCTLDIASAST
jgi:hypothetical protein